MNIAIIGYGKMGKTIERLAKNRGHKISLCYDKTPHPYLLKNLDVAIEFSQPSCAFNNVKICIENKIPVVCGTTGWLDKINIIRNFCIEKNGSFLYSSNFSIGVNIFLAINNKLSKLLSPYSKEYHVDIKEIHHKDKLDKPSGTAVSLAKEIINNNVKKKWILNENKSDKKNKENLLIIHSKRINNVIGKHSVTYKSNMEKILLQHEAYDRDIFAIGSIIAAEWILNKKGFYSMQDVLDI
ncbi:4-hydroxy-tetrahydrodipicolinate reductase [Blattabacterium cuenoti]|uniref:4-hydroxy-tetrahydrodipicolinate reductase n=1 Tax=Blattabacterium cuenoti TaxID=1653831 RepID=UPI00163CFEEE|nr:4-hydroxy-tetrahydrodipicolinate reductase [Blattabacterium cuenoti]